MIYEKAIRNLYPNTNVIVKHEDGTIEVYDIDGDLVEVDLDAIQSWVDPEAYKEQRRAEYPSFADQFDLLYHGGYDAWKSAIDAVKERFPK